MTSLVMQYGILVLCASIPLSGPAASPAKRPEAAPAPRSLSGSRAEIYKRIGEVELPIHIFEPASHKPGDRRPAIVFFFGGGWRSGSPAQFQHHCRYLASRGMVAGAATRTSSTPSRRWTPSSYRWVTSKAPTG